jgi:GTPase SAR1 family protein
MIVMKNKPLLLLTAALLSQTALCWAETTVEFRDLIEEANGVNPARIRIEVNQDGDRREQIITNPRSETLGYRLKTVDANGLRGNVSPHVLTAIPEDVNLGQSILRKRYTFDYNDQEYVIEADYGALINNRGRWSYTHDNDQQQTIAKLVLEARTAQGLREIENDVEIRLPHVRTQQGAQVQGGYRYLGGRNVSLTNYTPTTFENPITHETYIRNMSNGGGASIPTHQNRDIVFVQPFQLPGQRVAARPADYLKVYESLGEALGPNEAKPSIDNNPIIYVDGANRVYSTKVTHEKWRENGWNVGISIISKRNRHRLNFLDATIEGGDGLPEGTYQFRNIEVIRAQDGTGRYRETWQQLEDPTRIFKIDVPEGQLSLPGLKPSKFIRMTGTDEIADMQQRVSTTQETVEHALAEYADKDSIFVIGDSGTGKSVFIHALAGKQMQAYDDDGVMKIRIPEGQRLPGSRIGDGNGSAGTKSPTPWYDPDKNVVIWDCPGLRDPAGPAMDIVNAMGIHKSLKAAGTGRVRIGFTTEDAKFSANGQEFLGSLNRLSELFPDLETLKASLYIVVTKMNHQENYIRGKLRSYYQRQLPNAEGKYDRDRFQLTDNARALLEFLHQGEGRNHFIFFPEATDEEDHFVGVPQDQLWGTLDHIPGAVALPTSPLGRLDPNNPAFAEITLKVGNLSTQLNEQVSHYLKNQGYLEILEACNKAIRENVGTITDLRAAWEIRKTELTNLRDELPQLNVALNNVVNRERPLGDVELGILNRLGAFFNVDLIRGSLEGLKFLKRVKEDLLYDITNWSAALTKSINSINKILTKDGPSTLDGHTLTIKGLVLSPSDIEEELRVQGRENVKLVKVYATNSFHVDHDLTRPGLSIKIETPHVQVIGTRTIDLSGVNKATARRAARATPGANGGIGESGQTAGSLLINTHSYEGLENLTIKANAANGQGGQNGSDGASGAKGTMNPDRPGDQCRHIRHEHGISPGNHGNPNLTIYNTDHFSSDGNPGSRGQNGGQGGRGGAAGRIGEVTFLNLDTAELSPTQGHATITRNVAQAGEDGNPGAGGQAGEDGDNQLWARENWAERETGFLGIHLGIRFHHHHWRRENIETNHHRNPNNRGTTPAAPHGTGWNDSSPTTVIDQSFADYINLRRQQSRDPLTAFLLRAHPGLE